ncbi:4-(cytidine 5'-diphospho)-2-C-methyl-D-erythritol kinase [Rhodospirillaceae bacterium KN72]|uniref:4-diphosphocytidyl-2-C-methyl-D-erythritol kinase n=1 Tax=Pacificispira spongiicola TaxID=2729598 RepID=A0A7Y0DX85_9PROT|nr:4-(cytidine 5'-diphospho)-2-C-methyl-D-erythritol kinase [Pacificispira spongiicola]NMM43245.1 4-(cytidine 5'-diphospho)-2-C-methyl-D-erythritol kinase [Pacificispira spongiicola]
MTGPTFTMLAPAKVNLSLRITGRRADGYHLLDSLVAFTDFGDRLSVSPSNDITFSITGPFAGIVPADASNLVVKAAEALADRFDIPAGLGASLTLSKELPAAGGIGGGSADAASALRLLCDLWDIDPDHPALPGVALSLGADIPVCLRGRACRMSGIGETLSPIPPLPSLGIVLVNPGAPCPTPAVFKARVGSFSPAASSIPDAWDRETVLAFLADEPNDLTDAAVTVCPEIKTILTAFSTLPSCRLARMSGSGATCFGLFDTADSAQAAATALARDPAVPDAWWIKAGQLVS